jgi:hypothetical protein
MIRRDSDKVEQLPLPEVGGGREIVMSDSHPDSETHASSRGHETGDISIDRRRGSGGHYVGPDRRVGRR